MIPIDIVSLFKEARELMIEHHTWDGVINDKRLDVARALHHKWLYDTFVHTKRASKFKFDFFSWQKWLVQKIQEPPHMRKIYWFWSCREYGMINIVKHLLINYNTVVVELANNDPVTTSYIGYNVVIFINRGRDDKIPYWLLESVKDGLNQRDGTCTCTNQQPHVIVFSNTPFDRTKMSECRMFEFEVRHFEKMLKNDEYNGEYIIEAEAPKVDGFGSLW